MLLSVAWKASCSPVGMPTPIGQRVWMPSNQDMLQFGNTDGIQDYPDFDMNARPKRRWWGNKHRDNKSYGFWITALNKAGNVKRGKRSAFIPPMGAIVDDHNPLTGPSDYSDVAELVPDHKAAPVVHNVHQ